MATAKGGDNEHAPLFLMRSSAGKINHLFTIEDHVAIDAFLQSLDKTSSSTSTASRKYQAELTSLFGSISADGCLQVWDLMKRRPILTLNTHLNTTSWADFSLPNPQATISDIRFYLYSRKTGMYFQHGEKLEKNSLTRVPLEDVHFGFCKPLLISSKYLVCPYGSDAVVKLSDLTSSTHSMHQVPTSGPVTFLQYMEIGGQSYVLIGTESGSVSLMNLTTCSTEAACNLDKHRKEPSEEGLVPLCSDGESKDGIGHYLIGTATEELFLLKITGNGAVASSSAAPVNNTITIEVEKVFKLHRRGTSCIKLRPDGALIVVAGWDTKLRVFSFPNVKQLMTLACHSMTISSLTFLLVPVSKSKARQAENELLKGTLKSSDNESHGGQPKYYLLSSSHDSSVAVWDHLPS